MTVKLYGHTVTTCNLYAIFYFHGKVNTANPKNDTILSGALICKGNMTWSIFGLGAVE